MIGGGRASAAALSHHVELVKGSARVVKRLFPGIRKLYLVGASIRGKVGTDIDFVAEMPTETKPDQVINVPLLIKVPRRKRRVGVEVDVFFASPQTVKTTVLHYGLGKDIIRWKKIARSKGYKLNRYGLWKGMKRVTGSPTKIALILGTNLKPFIQATLDSPL
jgi:DNA polymerase/3'-5' exonuclease PolX